MKNKINRSFYASVHYWLKHTYGVAKKCENPNCSGKSENYNWAKKEDKDYDYKRDNFIQLCRSCHAVYDVTEDTRRKIRETSKNAKKTHCNKGHEFTKENTHIRTFKRNGKEYTLRNCRACKRLSFKKWAESHREYYLQGIKNWRTKNSEHVKEYRQKYYKK